MTQPAPYRLVARNDALASENKIHDDNVARSYGFAGGLVPGVTVFAYMTHPVVDHFGPAWLEWGAMRARFLAPVYDGEEITVAAEHDGNGNGPLRLSIADRAEGEAALAPADPPDLAAYPVAAMPDHAARPAPTAETLAPGTVLGTLAAHYRADRAPDYLDLIDDHVHLYRGDGAVAHPGWLLRFANYALSENVRLGPWIHVESAVQNFRDVHDGDEVSARARVADRFERKGHQLVTLDVLLLVDGEHPAMHVRHTAIYKPRKKEPASA